MSCLTKGFIIIELVVSRQNTGMTFTDIVNGTGLPKASVHRMLKELLEIGALRFDAETSKYRGNLKLASIGSDIVDSFDLREHVHTFLEQLHIQTGHTCALGVKDGDVGVYVDKCEASGYAIKLYSAVGKRFPLYCTALGKLILAQCDTKERDRILKLPMKIITAKTVIDPEALRLQMAGVRDQGYALDLEEITRGVICVAAPIFGMHGENVGAISLAFPSYFNEDRGIQIEIDAVKACASEISKALEEGKHA